MPSKDPLDELEEVLGPAALLTDPIDLARHTEPFRGPRGATPAVVRPSSVEEVREVVRWARRHRQRLLPQGANTGLVAASTPPPTGGPATVVVSTDRLAGDLRVDPVDRAAVVGAGTRLSALEAAAAPHGLTLPIDLGADPSIGGMVATNTGGARMLRHGDVRRHVLGVRAVVADEGCTVVDELTTLRKHNNGPSLSQAFVGSSGAFGIITDVAVELEALPAARACAWVIPVGDDQALEALLLLERGYGTWLEAFEVVSREALAAGLPLSDAARPFGEREPELAVLVELSGRADVEDRLVEALADLFDAGLLEDAVVADAGRAWLPRHGISEGLRRLGTVVGSDVSVPRPALPRFRRVARERVAQRFPGAIVADFGHWGDGGVHCNVVLPDGAGAEEVAAVRELVLGLAVREFGGSFSAEHGIGPVNADWWRATVPPATRALVEGMKQLFDPLGVLGHPGLPFGG